MSRLSALAIVAACLLLSAPQPLHAQVLINEIVADPQLDWNDSAGGNWGFFDDVPGTAPAVHTDEWVELLNVSGAPVDLTGWRLVMIDTTPATETLGTGGATLVFTAGSSLQQLLSGGRLVVGNPSGQINNNCYLVLEDAQGGRVDEVEIGTSDFAGDGTGNNAPSGDAHNIWDEAVARSPDGNDTDFPPTDFRHLRATIGSPNPGVVPPAQFLINEIVTDPQFDWNDSEGGRGIAFDRRPGTGAITDTDEWIELVNTSPFTGSLVNYSLVMHDTTPATETLGSGSATFVFESGGVLGRIAPGEHVVIGNPRGSMNNNIWLRLFDSLGNQIDEVELGNADFQGNGPGDEAPSGNATGRDDEAVARLPDAVTTGDDAADFQKLLSTIGRANILRDPSRALLWQLYR